MKVKTEGKKQIAKTGKMLEHKLYYDIFIHVQQ